MSILSSNKISIRQTPITVDHLLKYGFKPLIQYAQGIWQIWGDDYQNEIEVYFDAEGERNIKSIYMVHLSIPHGFLDLYERNQLKNLGQLMDLVWVSKAMKGSKDREIVQKCRINCLKNSSLYEYFII